MEDYFDLGTALMRQMLKEPNVQHLEAPYLLWNAFQEDLQDMRHYTRNSGNYLEFVRALFALGQKL